MTKPREKRLTQVDDGTVSVIVVTYNSSRWIPSCFDLLETSELDGLELELIVVDNASTDDSVALLAERGVQVVTSGSNLGFAAAVNLGVRLTSGRWVLLLNPDCLVGTHAIANLVQFLESNGSFGIAGGRNQTVDGRTDPSSCWGLPSLWSMVCFATGLSTMLRGNRLFDPESLGPWDRTTARRVPMVSGAFLLIRRSLWDQLGGFDETFWLYGEDADLAARARSIGVKSGITPAAVVVHGSGASSTTHADKMVLVLRGKVTYAKRHIRPAWAAVALLRCGVLFRSLASLALCRSTAWPEIWNRRREWRVGYEPPGLPDKSHGAG